jgi:hypothetical protein
MVLSLARMLREAEAPGTGASQIAHTRQLGYGHATLLPDGKSALDDYRALGEFTWYETDGREGPKVGT